KNITIKNLKLSMFGKHQAINAAVAITAILQSGITISVDSIRKALKNISFSGRNEVVSINGQTVIIDGAHNVLKISALAELLKDHFPGQKFSTLIAIKKDKDIRGMVKKLSPYISKWYLFTFNRQTDWGEQVMYGASDLAEIIKLQDKSKPITIVPKLTDFLNELKKKNNNEVFLVTGSLYLVGYIEEWMKANPQVREYNK
ncbi:glutamate ligase domain-containing protein, partial [Patescibacteria group bacterium]